VADRARSHPRGQHRLRTASRCAASGQSLRIGILGNVRVTDPEALALTIPQSILDRADEIIE
jgi:hypothetical protein